MFKNLTRLSFTLLIGFFITSCATYVVDEQAVVEHGCDDVVVLGRAKTLSYSLLERESDSIGFSLFKFEITVKRVLYGSEPRRVVNASSIAHGHLRDDLDFIFVLTPSAGDYEIESGTIWKMRPRPVLAKVCSE